MSLVGRGGALVKSMNLNRRVVGSTPALAATWGLWASPLQWRSNRGFSRFKEPGPPTVRAPDRGQNLFCLQDATNQDSEETEIRPFVFSKMPRAYLLHS